MDRESKIMLGTVLYKNEEIDGRDYAVPRVNYLALLSGFEASTNDEIRRCKTILSETDNPESDICKLLKLENWRPHLVACAVTFHIKLNNNLIAALWSAFDNASWVCPQIAATLSLLDEDFYNNALSRLKTGVLLIDPEDFIVKMEGTKNIPNPKGFMSLWGLVNEDFPNDEWITTEEAAKLKAQLEPKDHACSGDIALNWRGEVKAMLNKIN